jgi:hypothetical protein
MPKTTSKTIRTVRSWASTRSGLICLIAGMAMLASLANSAAALASRGQSTVFDLGGTALDLSKQDRDSELDQLRAFGVDTVRVIVAWERIAPNPGSPVKPAFNAADPAAYPAGNWINLDDLVQGAQARGMNVLLTPSSPVPVWGSPSHESFTDPNPGEFQLFVQALGTRYSGTYSPPPIPPSVQPNPPLPRVSLWTVWNEPNLTLFLKPQLRHGKSVSGRIYRELFLAAQRGLVASGHGADPVLIGETSPGPGRTGTDPVTFVRGVFCLNRKFKRRRGCAPIDADGWALHPYDPLDPPFKTSRSLVNLETISGLAEALNKARAARGTTRRLPIYVTEYGIESVPDRQFGVSQLRQAEYIGISEYLMYRNPRIRTFGQYLLRDDPGSAQTNFQTGLRFADGAPKLSYAAFPITLMAQRRSKGQRKVIIWGHVRPHGGPFRVTVSVSGPGASHPLRTVGTNAAGYFQFRTSFRKRRRYSASTLLPDGSQLTGPFVRVYVFK